MAKIKNNSPFLNINKVNNIQDEENNKNQNDKDSQLSEETTVDNHITAVNDTEGSLCALEQIAMLAKINMTEKQSASISESTDKTSDNTQTIQITDKMSISLSVSTNGGFSYEVKDNKVTFFGTDCTITINETSENNLDDIDVILWGSGITLNSDAHVNSITNNATDSIINGSELADNIINRASRSKVYGKEGNDNIISSGFKSTIDGGEGDDNITSTGDYSKITGGSGENNIFAQGFNVEVNKSEDTDEATSDSIIVRGSDVTVDASKGENTVIADGRNIEVKSGENAQNDIELTGQNHNVTNQTANDYIVKNNERDTTGRAEAHHKNGLDDNGKMYLNGNLMNGLYVDNKMYKNGELLTGVSPIDNKYYQNGAMPSGLRLNNENGKYYFNGILADGKIDGTEFIEGICQGEPPVIGKIDDDGKLTIDEETPQGLTTYKGAVYYNGILADSVNSETGEVTFIEGNYYRVGEKLCSESEYETCIDLVNKMKENNPTLSIGSDISSVTYYDNSTLIKSFTTSTAENTGSIKEPSYHATGATTYTIVYDEDNNISTISTTKELDDNKKTVTVFNADGVKTSETTYQGTERISSVEYDNNYRYEISYTNDKPTTINIYNNTTNEWACTQTYTYNGTEVTITSDYPDSTSDIVVKDTERDTKNKTGYDAAGNETYYVEYPHANSSDYDYTFYRAVDDYLGLFMEVVEYTTVDGEETKSKDYYLTDITYDTNNKLTSFIETDTTTWSETNISVMSYDETQQLILYKKTDAERTEKYYTVSSSTGIPTESEISTIKQPIFEGGTLANCTINGVTYVGGEIQETPQGDNFSVGDDGKLYNNGKLVTGLQEYNNVTYYNGVLADSVNSETGEVTFIEGNYYRVGKKLCSESEYETCIDLVNKMKENNPTLSIGSDISSVTYYDNSTLIKSFTTSTAENTGSIKEPSYHATGATTFTITYDDNNNISEISTTKELDDNKKTVTIFNADGVKTSETTYQGTERISRVEYDNNYRYEISYTNDKPTTINIYNNTTNELACTQKYFYTDTLRIIHSTNSDGTFDITSNYIEDNSYNIAQQDLTIENDILKSFSEINMNTYDMFTISDIVYDETQHLILYKKTDDIYDTYKYYTVSSTTGIPTKDDISKLETNITTFNNGVLADCTINGVTYVDGEIQTTPDTQELTETQQAFLNTIDSMRSDLTTDDIQSSSISFTGNSKVEFTTTDGNSWTCEQTTNGYTIQKTQTPNEKYEQATYNSSKQLSQEIIVDTSNEKSETTTKTYNATTSSSTLTSQKEETSYGLVTKYQTFGDDAKTYTIDEENYYDYMEILNSLDYDEISSYVDIELLTQRQSSSIDPFIDYELSEAIKGDIMLLDEADDLVKADTTGQLTFADAVKSLMVPDYTSLSKTNAEIITETKIGDVIQKDDTLYVHDVNDELVELNMDIDTYLELFPPVGRYTADQNGYGDCYFVAGIMLGSIENPSSYAEILKMFSVNETTGDITVNFGSYYLKDYPVTFEYGELFDVDLSCHESEDYQADHSLGTATGSKGVQMLEQAYSVAMFAYENYKTITELDIDEIIDEAMDDIGHGGASYLAEEYIFSDGNTRATIDSYLVNYGTGKATENTINNTIEPLYNDLAEKTNTLYGNTSAIENVYTILDDDTFRTAIENVTYYGIKAGYNNIWETLSKSGDTTVSNLKTLLGSQASNCSSNLSYLAAYESYTSLSPYLTAAINDLKTDDNYCNLVKDVYEAKDAFTSAANNIDYYLYNAIFYPYEEDTFYENWDTNGLYYALVADRDTFIEDCADTLADNDAVLTVATRSLDQSGFSADDNADSKGITDSHSYLIESIDKENKTITITNPWRGSLTTEITYDDLCKYFGRIDAFVTSWLKAEEEET